ncbi:unnamed protein product [Effrenium voratum]|uniref:Uncharacterized protein n=1 Tax=Effrenium voratum TaxID=2562239 RepID=A0AA36MPH4_9DINO|nr:unnamed protein product [Effrenium voratum]|mmetsp:Transcript_78527/g.188366  ORF Transcript_78527/g.188366 Transcript_78527/m.188366 type:complete len:224 (-) Transcript_78527:267-938(-)|eukprot:CAMPEP_0181442428 /NCGR_PEP_ID=MMETSP1110-20121109/24020_1 /TAXON_ID=174948 /ORGANISM="Symbiodinium sp., Strain CCMP421" /LENGTH=223 /DNA_ID=CAMNT_0023566347 /DNA_START=62 /DNA_END=733 /DNA_ORIENTATION=-
MGGGASSAVAFSAAAGKMEEKDLEEIVKNLDKEALKKLQGVVNRVADGSMDASKDASSSKEWHNAKEASSMKQAIFMWNPSQVYEAMWEDGIEWALPKDENGTRKGTDGTDLLTKKIFAEEQQNKWESRLKSKALFFFHDQVAADVPYVPPESARPHAVYLWTESETLKALKEIGVDTHNFDGQKLLKVGLKDMMWAFEAADMVEAEGKKFFEAVAKFMQSEK